MGKLIVGRVYTNSTGQRAKCLAFKLDGKALLELLDEWFHCQPTTVLTRDEFGIHRTMDNPAYHFNILQKEKKTGWVHRKFMRGTPLPPSHPDSDDFIEVTYEE